MKITKNKPFTFKGGKRAVLLLHGFTGDSADVRMLGRFLEKHGYTAHAPIYRGHTEPLEALLNYTPEDWWEDVVRAYHHLREMGHDEIAVCGLSLGGLFSLKLGYSLPVKGIVPMCAPMKFRDGNRIFHEVLRLAREYKRMEGKTEEQIRYEMENFDKTKLRQLIEANERFIQKVRSEIDMIYAPIFVVQARKDEMVDPESAKIIFSEVQSPEKSIKWYEHSGHVITVDRERDELHRDVLAFLDRLDWSE